MVGLEVPQSGVKKPRKPGGVRGVRIGGTAGGPDRWDVTLPDMLGPTVQANPLRSPLGIEFEPELGGYHHLPAKRRKDLAD